MRLLRYRRRYRQQLFWWWNCADLWPTVFMILFAWLCVYALPALQPHHAADMRAKARNAAFELVEDR